MLSVKINDFSHTFADGISILQAVRQSGIQLPTLCSDERLKPMGGCRLCVVQVQGWPRPVTACTTPLTDGLEIHTHTPELERDRRTLLKLLAQDYPIESVEQAPEKEFHRYLREYGLVPAAEGVATLARAWDSPQLAHDSSQPTYALGERGYSMRDNSHPYIHVDMAKCVTCLRCVRICDEVQGQFVWQVWDRGDRTSIRPDSGTTLLESSCVSCGACVDTCPTGALEDKSILTHGQPTSWTKTTCPYCGTGCEMQVGVREEPRSHTRQERGSSANAPTLLASVATQPSRIVAVRPEMLAPVNHGHLCVKGRYAFDFVHASDRITEPMLRSRGGEWQTVSWDIALAHVAEQFQRIVARYGPAGIGVLGSARATNEENYLAQKFARVVLGTNNVDCCARVCHAPTAAAMKAMLGTGAATNSFNDIELAQTILVAGSNATENHPIVGARIKQAALRGAHLIVIDPRKIELTKYAECHLQLHPGTNVLLFNALAAAIVEEGLIDADYVSQRVAEVESFDSFIREFSPEVVAERCGVPAKLIRQAARLYATAKPAMCLHGLGMTEHVQGTEGVMCLVNLAILTGNMGRPGSGINPLRGQNNVQGSAQMGCEPGSLTGFVSIAAGKSLFEQVWQVPVPQEPGLNLLKMMDAAQSGTFKALWAIGYDVLLTNANTHTTREAMRNLECVVVQDMFLNETAKEFGTVFLPCASSFEKDGTFMNAERRIQRVREAIAPLGQSKSDADIVCLVAQAMGANTGFTLGSAEEIWNEIRQVWKAVAGISYSRLEAGGLQWPCPTEDHPGTTILHGESFPIGKRAALQRIEHRPTDETVTDEFPFLLSTGRTLYHFNAGTMTLRTPNAVLRPHDLLDMSPTDAARLELIDGAAVTIRSRHGEAMLPLRINSDIPPGELFATFHEPHVFLNHVTSPHRDSVVHAPEYKVTAVQVRKAP
ncbi:MAG: formate dehydrogenase subunit alpha [Planctomycetales bacterium]|nr:formate dehydrogenase subunit alpha [Planctomycetales bacterium]